jgi:5-oxoprolinase (ATP-hydrolysing) subunit A
MLRRLDLNSDMGERDTAEGLALDAALMPLITSVSIACGGHAGSRDLMRRTASLAQKHGVAIGAHPGLPDRQTFGRAERRIPDNELRVLVSEQVMTCGRVMETEGFKLRHVKPHGALYNMAAGNEGIAEAIVTAVREVDGSLLLYALAGSVLARVGEAGGLGVIHEGFADRAYRANGQLVPRSEAGAVIQHEDSVREQLRQLIDGSIMTVERTLIPVSIQSLCLHSDTPKALVLARMIREELERAGIEVLAASHVDH